VFVVINATDAGTTTPSMMMGIGTNMVSYFGKAVATLLTMTSSATTAEGK
jgi:hypothetical protein